MLIPHNIESYAATPLDMLLSSHERAPAYAEFLKAAVGGGFEHTDFSTALTEDRVRSAENAAYGGYSQDYSLTAIELGETQKVGFLKGATPELIAKEDWNESHPHYRKRIKWRENLTEIRARIDAEDYDEREFRKAIVSQGISHYGFLGGTVPAFLAGMVGSLPDSINLIPFGRAFGTGKGLVSGIKTGIIDGALSSAAADALTLPILHDRGADVGFADFFLNSAMSGVLGGALGGVGGWLGGKNAARYAAFQERVSDYVEHGINVNHMSLAADRMAERQFAADLMRRTLPPDSKEAVLRGMAAVYDDVINSRPVDVRSVAGVEKAISRMYDIALRHPVRTNPHEMQVELFFENLAGKIEKSFFDIGTALPDGSISPDLDFGMVKIQVKHGEVKIKTVMEDPTATGKDKKKARDNMVTKEEIMAVPSVLREYKSRQHQGRGGGYYWIVPTDDSKKNLLHITKQFTEIDNAQHIVTLHKISKSQTEKLGGVSQKKGAVSTSSSRGFAPLPEIPPVDLNNAGSAPYGTARPTKTAGSRSNGGLNTAFEHKISPEEALVNKNAIDKMLELLKNGELDSVDPPLPPRLFTVERAEKYREVPPKSQNKEASALAEIDPETGLLPEERLAMLDVENGRATPEAAATLRQAQEAELKRQQMEEAGYQIAGCVTEVVE